MFLPVFRITGHETKKCFNSTKHKYISTISCTFRLKINDFITLKMYPKSV